MGVQMLFDMPEELSQLIKSDNFAEIVFRGVNQKFSQFAKVAISNSGNKEELAKKVVSAMTENNEQLSSVRKTLNGINANIGDVANRIGGLTESTKNMAINVDKIVQGMNGLSKISFINMALSVVNIAIDVTGFVIVNKKLNILSTEIKKVAERTEDINIKVDNELISEFDNMMMDYNYIAQKLSIGDPASYDEIDKLLRNMNAYLSKLVNNINSISIGIDVWIKIIMALIPAYTALLSEYVKKYYFEKGILPANYELFVSVYASLIDLNLRTRIIDYYFLYEKMNLQDSVDLINVLVLLAINCQTRVEDQVELIRACVTEEKYKAVDLELAELARKRLKESAEELIKESGVDEELLQVFMAC